MRRKRANLNAFTLIEMLVAVFVIAILVVVVVGVSGIVVSRAAMEHTRNSMAIITEAVDAYRRTTGGALPGEPTEMPSPMSGWRKRDWRGYIRGRRLYEQMMANAAAQDVLAALPPDAIASPQGGNRTFVDGFGKYMDYSQSKGAKGAVLLISAGPDGDFDRQEDNLRSDGL